jgi:hypothetical protein
MAISYEAAFGAGGAGGGKTRASTTEAKPHRLWVPSQKGLLDDWPQRQSDIWVRPARSKAFPSWSTIVKSPSIRMEPLLRMVTTAPAM